jgi:hypothetical protein
MVKPEPTIGEFIERLLETNVAEAGDWLKNFSDRLPPEVWQKTLEEKMTKIILQWFMRGIPAQISEHIKGLHLQKRDYRASFVSGRIFLQEIMEKAKEYGIDTSGIEITSIIKPG